MKYLKILKLAGILFFFIFLLQDGLLIYNSVHNDEPVLGLKLYEKKVSGLKKPQLYTLLKKEYDSNQPLRLSYGKKIFTVQKSEIGGSLDYDKTVSNLLNKGRSGGLFTNINIQNKAFWGLEKETIKTNVSSSLLLIKILGIADEINQESLPSMPDFKGNMDKTLPPREGLKVDTANLSLLAAHYIFFPQTNPIPIPVKTVVRKFTTVGLEEIRKKAKLYTVSPISVKAGGLTFTLTSLDLRALLSVAERVDPKNPRENILALIINDNLLNKKLSDFATRVEAATHAEFNEYAARTAVYAQFYSNTRRLTEIPTGLRIIPPVLGVQTANGPKTAYLTFDDGPNITYHPMLLDILRAKGVKATFYMVGSSSKLYKSITERTVAEGHAIGNHTLTHPFLPKLPENKIYDEIKSTGTILDSFTGKKTSLFRPPYGGTNSYVSQITKNLNLTTEFWNVDPRDWTDPSTEELVNRVVSNTNDGSIILLHSNHFATVKALPLIIDKLKEKGYQFKLQS